jgi:hypothetical protein
VPVTVNKRGAPSGPRAYRSRDSRVLSRCGNMQSSTQTEQHRDLFGRVSVCLSMSSIYSDCEGETFFFKVVYVILR